MSSILLAFLLAVVVGFGILAALLVLGSGRVKRHFRKAQRVVPGVESAAPLDWVGAHTPEATLHRRLGKATAGLRAATENDPAASANVAAVEREALKIEERLVAVSHLAERLKTPALADLEAAVEQIEDVSGQLIHRSAGLAGGDIDAQLAELAERLDLLDAARAELDEDDRKFGLGETT